MPTSMRTATLALAALLAGCAASVGVESPSQQPSAAATASATPVPAAFGAADLPRIVLSEDHLRTGMTLDDLTSGFDALVQPVDLLESSVFAQQPGFVDARMTRIGTSAVRGSPGTGAPRICRPGSSAVRRR